MAFDFIDGKKLAARIVELKEELTKLLHLESFLNEKPGRSRPSKPVKSALSMPKKRKLSRKRGALGESIVKFLATKGKEGAHVKDIAAHLGVKPTNVTAWAYSTGKRKVKKTKPATFALKD